MSSCSSKNRLQSYVPNSVPNSWSDFDALINQVLAPTVARSVRGVRAPMSVWEADDTYHIELDLPGVAKEDVELTFEKDTLVISADRKAPEETRKGLHEERVYGTFTRSLTLSEAVETDSIAAELNNGVLHVSVSKVPEVRPKKIDIA